MVVGVGFHPVLVVAGALAEHFLAHPRQSENLTDKIDHLLGPRPPAQIAVDDDAVETMVGKGEQISEQLDELFHASALYSSEETDSGSPTQPSRSGTAMGGGQILPSGRRSSLHSG